MRNIPTYTYGVREDDASHWHWELYRDKTPVRSGVASSSAAARSAAIRAAIETLEETCRLLRLN